MDWVCTGCGRHYSWLTPGCSCCIGAPTTTTGGTQPASTNKQSDAITLWKEFVAASTHGYPVSWVQANGTRINTVVA